MTRQQSAQLAAIMAAIFDVPRDPRSPEYKRGCRDMLAAKLTGTKLRDRPLPYKLGTAQADAYFSGQDEGRHKWNNLPEHILLGQGDPDELPPAMAATEITWEQAQREWGTA